MLDLDMNILYQYMDMVMAMMYPFLEMMYWYMYFDVMFTSCDSEIWFIY